MLSKKFVLRRETLRKLTSDQLRLAHGGLDNGGGGGGGDVSKKAQNEEPNTNCPAGTNGHTSVGTGIDGDACNG